MFQLVRIAPKSIQRLSVFSIYFPFLDKDGARTMKAMPYWSVPTPSSCSSQFNLINVRDIVLLTDSTWVSKTAKNCFLDSYDYSYIVNPVFTCTLLRLVVSSTLELIIIIFLLGRALAF